MATHIGNHVEAEIESISQLPSNSTVFQYWVHILAISSNCRGLEVLDVLADSETFSRKTKLLLDSFEGEDGSCGAVCSEQIPGIKSRKVLESS